MLGGCHQPHCPCCCCRWLFLAGSLSSLNPCCSALQLKYIFGVSYSKQDTLQGELSMLIKKLQAGGFVWQEFVMGSCMIIFLWALKVSGRP